MTFRRYALALIALLLLAGPLLAEETGPEFLTRVYDVGFLTRTVRDHPFKPLGMITPSYDMDGPVPFEEEERGIEIETVMAMLQGVTADWEDPASIQNTETYIIVVHREPVHKRIGILLDSIRNKRGTTVTCTIEAWSVTGPTGAGSEGVFPEKEGAAFLEKLGSGKNAKRVRAWILTGFSGQKVAAWEGTEQPYLRDYDVEVAQESSIADPMVETLREGMSFAIRPTVAGEGQVLLDIQATLATLLGDILEKDYKTEKMGALDRPVMHIQEFETSLLVPDRGVAVLGSFDAPAGTAPGASRPPGSEKRGTGPVPRYLVVVRVKVREAFPKGE